MGFAVVGYLIEGPIIEALITLKIELSVICLVDTWRPAISFIQQQLIWSVNTFTRNYSLRCCLE
jgi:hypothetical protein